MMPESKGLSLHEIVHKWVTGVIVGGFCRQHFFIKDAENRVSRAVLSKRTTKAERRSIAELIVYYGHFQFPQPESKWKKRIEKL